MNKDFKVEDLIEEGDVCPYTGTVKVKMPLYHERARFANDIGLNNYKAVKGEDEEAKLRDGLAQMDIMARASEKVMGFVVSCELKTEEGLELKTAEELYSEPDAAPIVTGLTMKFLSGFVTKKLKASSDSK